MPLLAESIYDPQRWRREMAFYDDLRHRFDDPPWLVEAKLSHNYDPHAVVEHELNELRTRFHVNIPPPTEHNAETIAGYQPGRVAYQQPQWASTPAPAVAPSVFREEEKRD